MLTLPFEERASGRELLPVAEWAPGGRVCVLSLLISLPVEHSVQYGCDGWGEWIIQEINKSVN